jgi:hypothetical protein
MFTDFDFEILDDPDFKEDAVREELILPLIKRLGYSVTGDDRNNWGQSKIKSIP